jgi:glycosyltransferase involved in cell wall biosynthesis
MGNKINIAIITTFTNSLLNAKLIPLSKIAQVENILLVCDKPGPAIEKVTYILPPRLLYKIALHKSFAKLFMLLYIIKKYKTKVIMAYNIFPHGINAWMAGKIFGGTIIQHFPGGYAELTVKKEISDNSLVKNFPVAEKLVEKINRFVTKNSNYLMVPGQRTKDYLINDLNIKSEKIYKIHSTVDVSRFIPVDSDKIYDIVVAANFRKVKRLDMFIDIIARIKECMPNIKAIILGDGELRSELVSR